MTTKQKEFVERLSGREALKIYGDLWRKDMHRAKEFWAAWETTHQSSHGAVREEKNTVVKLEPQKKESALNTITQSYFAWQVKEEKHKAIFKLLSDMQPHSRQELLQLFKEKGWEQDIEFRKHISEIRKHLAACMSPYYIPLNPKGKGCGIYQLKSK